MTDQHAAQSLASFGVSHSARPTIHGTKRTSTLAFSLGPRLQAKFPHLAVRAAGPPPPVPQPPHASYDFDTDGDITTGDTAAAGVGELVADDMHEIVAINTGSAAGGYSGSGAAEAAGVGEPSNSSTTGASAGSACCAGALRS